MSTTAQPRYLCPATGDTYPLGEPRWRSDAGRPLMITPLPGIRRDAIDSRRRSLWRYAAALPVEIAEPVSLGEGVSPLLPVTWSGAGLHMKLEFMAPTGSFKDRGASVMVSYLRQCGISRILEDSSGNGGAAIASYAAAAGIACKILVPAYTPPTKIVQMRAAGAEVELVPGTRQDTADEAERQAGSIFYASHNWQAFFLQGTKTLAYELWEDLGFRAPDNIIIPCGAGSNVLGCDIGFRELLAAGEIDRLPRLFAVQPENCAPIDAAFRAGSDVPVPVEIHPTVAEGTAISRPVRLKEVLDAVRGSQGATVAVSEAAIRQAVVALARRGLYVEPTSAGALAAVEHLLAAETIQPDETTVVVLTGSGLKATQRIAEILGVPG